MSTETQIYDIQCAKKGFTISCSIYTSTMTALVDSTLCSHSAWGRKHQIKWPSDWAARSVTILRRMSLTVDLHNEGRALV